jgi:hypothetical protein
MKLYYTMNFQVLRFNAICVPIDARLKMAVVAYAGFGRTAMENYSRWFMGT